MLGKQGCGRLVHLPASTRTAKPWKNGGGIVWDVAMHDDRPEETHAFARFLWRVSIAEVASEGPFSVFPGIDRTIAILKGDGMRLVVGDTAPATLTPTSPALAFPGDVATSATLTSGPVLDLNVMVRRGEAEAKMTRLDLLAGERLTLPAVRMLVFCGEAVTVQSGEQAILLADLDAVQLEGATGVQVQASKPAVLWLINILDHD